MSKNKLPKEVENPVYLGENSEEKEEVVDFVVEPKTVQSHNEYDPA